MVRSPVCLFPVTIAMSVAGFILTAAVRPAAAATDRSRPNVIVIMADDMGYECLTANGGQTYQTPRLDRLARQGMRFEYCISQPICTPSRVKIMTGRPNSRNYIRFGYLDPNAHTFGQLFKQAGYATAVVGKWQLSNIKEKKFDDPHHFGFDEYCLWQLTRRPGRYPNPGLEINGREVDFTHGEYGPDIVSDYACRFIEKNKDKPFFLYYPMILPHWPFEPTPDGPDWDPTSRGHFKMREQKYFVEMVHYADKLVGKIVDKVDQLGLDKKTLILFNGDNGTFTGITSRWKGQTWRGGKGTTTDAGTRVPLIARWPGHIPAGRVNTHLVDFSDFLPTLAEAAGLTVPSDWQVTGRSFFAQLLDQPATPRDWVYVWYFRHGKPVAPRPGSFVAGEFARTHRYKLYRDGRFFNLANDRLEQQPLDASDLTDEQRQIKTTLHSVIEQYTRPGFYEALNRESTGNKPANKNKHGENKRP